MGELKIAFIVLASLSIVFNLIYLLTEEKKIIPFSAVCGWTCALMWAIMHQG